MADCFRGIFPPKVSINRICLLGFEGSGKSAILKRLTDDNQVENVPTRGIDIKSLTHQVSGKVLLIHEFGGSDIVRNNIRISIQCVFDGIIYVIDSSNRRRLVSVGIELFQILDDSKLQGVPLLIFANKQDSVNALSITELSDGLNLHSICDRHWQIVGSSAKSGVGLQEGIDFMVSHMKQ